MKQADLLDTMYNGYVGAVFVTWWVCRIDIPRALLNRFAPVIADMLLDVEIWFEELI